MGTYSPQSYLSRGIAAILSALDLGQASLVAARRNDTVWALSAQALCS